MARSSSNQYGRYPNPNQSTYPCPNPNRYPSTTQNPNPSTYPNQYPSISQNPYPSTYPNRYPSTYPNPYQYPDPSTYPNPYQSTSQNPNQSTYPNPYPYPDPYPDPDPSTYPDSYPSTYQSCPYPSDLSAASFITVKLSGSENYHMWETQMRCLLESHGMLGFITDRSYRHQALEESGSTGDSYKLWRRSDAVVKGWIFGSLSHQTLAYVLHCLREDPDPNSPDPDALDIWNRVEKLYSPQLPNQIELPDPREEPIDEVHERLHNAILAGNWDVVDSILNGGQVTVIDKINNNGNTTLHEVACTNKKPKLFEKLLERIPENTQLLDVRNSDGSTLLHVAAIVGNTEAAEILATKDPNLVLVKDEDGHTPLAIALFNMDTKMSHILLHHMNTRFSDKSGDEILAILISSKEFRMAHDLLESYTTLNDDTVLMAIAQNFPNGLNILEKYMGTGIGSGVKKIIDRVQNDMVKSCVPLCGYWVENIFRLFFVGIYGIIMFLPLILKMLVWPFIKKRVRIHGDAMELLSRVCQLINEDETLPKPRKDYYKNPIVEATRQNAYEVVECIVRSFRNAIWTLNQDGHNIIQYAVISRSEKVYNLVYQMSAHKNVHRTMKDFYENNLLHLAGKLAPSHKLDVISGAFLQIQSELQWFKEVEGFVSPLSVKQKNFFGETPQMAFTREHKDLVIEGEKWLKATAESYTITAALITTIVFAAAITVPGGNNQDTGIPVFTNKTAFTLFAISDAISLLAAVTSLLMFMSILTSRFAEQDFLLKLPTKLIIGLVTLFISTTAMLVASGATLYLVFGQSNSKILITIVVFTCLPIAAFVTLQSHVVIDLMSATYGLSIFGKKRDRPFY